MVALLGRLHDLAVRRRWWVVAVWLIIALGAVPLTLQQESVLNAGGFKAPGDASAVDASVARDFASGSSATFALVVDPMPYAQRAAAQAVVDSSVADIGSVPGTVVHRDQIRSAVDALADGRPGIVAVDVPAGSDAAIDVSRRVNIALGTADEQPVDLPTGYRVMVTGQGPLYAALQVEAVSSSVTAELIGMPILLVVLLAAFGSLLASLLPVALGAMSVGVSGALIFLIAHVTEMSSYVTNAVSMIGLGVAVDYSLFVLARYRGERRAGRTHEAALRVAMTTSGVAVAFSGLTVMAAMAALFITDSMALTSMAIGVIIVVALSVLLTATLLPALITLTRRRLETKPSREARSARIDAFWRRWTREVMRRPVIALLGSVAVLLILAIPATDLVLQNSALRQLPEDAQSRQGAEVTQRAIGPGALGTILVLVHGEDGRPAPQSAVDATGLVLLSEPDLMLTAYPERSRDGSEVLYRAIPRTDAESAQARDLVALLRDELTDIAPGATVSVGGTTASIMDFDDLITQRLPWLILFVITLAFVILLWLLRAPVLALKAVLMNVLSIMASFGVVVAAFQWGWFSFLGLETAPGIDTIVPPLLVVIAFGLSMDYEVFLLGQVKERWEATGDNTRAVSEGLSASAQIITSAALIMVAVSLAFVTAGLPSIQRLGLGCATAIALDATVVRLVLVPAAMQLLGRWNWWTPRILAPRRPRPADPHGGPAGSGEGGELVSASASRG